MRKQTDMELMFLMPKTSNGLNKAPMNAWGPHTVRQWDPRVPTTLAFHTVGTGQWRFQTWTEQT